MDIQSVNKKLVSGFLTLTFRRALLFAIRFITINLFLVTIYPPSVIGIFNLANSVLAFFTFFSDVGLGASVIQKKELSQDDLKTTFTIQLILAAIITSILFIGAPQIATFYNIEASGIWLIRALSIGFFFTTLKVLPSILLERELRFAPLVLVEVIETIAFCGLLLGISLLNPGLHAFSFAALTQTIIGVIAIYIIAPWRVAIGITKTSMKTLLNFGVPFQLNSLLALLKDRLVPLVVAHMITKTELGYIGWAQSLAFASLEVMNIMIRITFPAFSRLQDDKEGLKRTMEKSIFFTAFLMYPVLFGVMSIAPSLVEHVVKSKWEPALPLVYLFSVTAFWAALSTPFTNFLNAIGRVGITLKLMIMWTALEWLITPILTLKFGFFGVAIASSLISFTSIIPIIIIKRTHQIEIFKNIWQPLVAALTMATVTLLLSNIIVKDIWTLLPTILIGGLVYLSVMMLFAKDRVISYIKNIRS